jgi:cysteine desulfurase
MNETIYLDHNATTPLLPEVVDAMLPYLRERFGNPSSSHPIGRLAREAVETARGRVAALIEADPSEVFFTSGGTEANNLAIRGAAEARPDRREIVTSAIEHPAVTAPCGWLERHGWRVTRLGVDSSGRVRVSEAQDAVGNETLLVSLMHSNNETGVLQPVAEVARAARERGALVHTDAAQSIGKVPVSVRGLGVDLLSIAGHKLYAPKGVGALFVRRGTVLRPFLLGAGHERGVRPGTENVASIVGLGAASEIARRDVEAEGARLRLLREDLWERLRAEVPDIALNGEGGERLPNTLNVRFPRASGTAILRDCPAIAASTGSACHGDVEQASAVILAMGVEPAAALGSVRLTLGRSTSVEDVTRAAKSLAAAWRDAVSRADGS